MAAALAPIGLLSRFPRQAGIASVGVCCLEEQQDYASSLKLARGGTYRSELNDLIPLLRICRDRLPAHADKLLAGRPTIRISKARPRASYISGRSTPTHHQPRALPF